MYMSVLSKPEAQRNWARRAKICASLDSENWTEKMDRVGRAIWELLHAHPEVGYVRAEVHLEGDAQPQMLATDAAGGVLWIDETGSDNRQVILPGGRLARKDS
jgi:hypothetical protein